MSTALSTSEERSSAVLFPLQANGATRLADTSAMIKPGNSVRDKKAFFESVGTENGRRGAATLSQLIKQRQAGASERSEGGDGAPAPASKSNESLEQACRLSQHRKLASYSFEATESWQLSLAAGDIVHLTTTPSSHGWTECVLISEHQARHGQPGWVPTAYLTELRSNQADIACVSKSRDKLGGRQCAAIAKKYKPVAKNLKSGGTTSSKTFRFFK